MLAKPIVSKPDVYSELEIYGKPRLQGLLELKRLKENNETQCLIYGKRTFSNLERCQNIKHIINGDNRIESMLNKLNITYPLPIQRYLWPMLSKEVQPPCVCISNHTSGKTYSFLLHIMFETIKDLPMIKTGDLDEEATDSRAYEPTIDDMNSGSATFDKPKYIIVCSSQYKVYDIINILDEMKGTLHELPSSITNALRPTVASLENLDTQDQIALKCAGKEILVGTPQSLVKCLDAGFLELDSSMKLIFDDIDVSLQLQTASTRNLVKEYMNTEDEYGKSQIYIFARKWTELVEHFVNNVFYQKTLIFGSTVEAAVYSKLRFDIDGPMNDDLKNERLVTLLEYSKNKKLCIVCQTVDEGTFIKSHLEKKNILAEIVEPDNIFSVLRKKKPIPLTNKITLTNRNEVKQDPIYIITDSSVELAVELISNFQYLIHYSIPRDNSVFDRRFRLMNESLKNSEKDLVTTLMLSDKVNYSTARLILDIVYRSTASLPSTKFELRDIVRKTAEPYCWRWATTGICRLEKLDCSDRLGSYCNMRHFIDGNDLKTRTKFDGQIRITITRLVNPNEIYFWIDGFRSINSESGKWITSENEGFIFMRDVQEKLNVFRSTKPKSIPFEMIKRNKVYGLFLPQEARVDRVILLEEPVVEDLGANISMLDQLARPTIVYNSQVEALRIDYGIKNHVYLKNIFELPETLQNLKPMANRGLILGFQPADKEPDWLYSAKNLFHEHVCVQDAVETTAWVRQEIKGTFWLESLSVVRSLSNINQRRGICKKPHEILYDEGLADRAPVSISFLNSSQRLEAKSKWNADKLKTLAQFAFLRKENQGEDIYLLHIDDHLNAVVRKSDYNSILVEIEADIIDEYHRGCMKQLFYFEVGTLCIAKISDDLVSSVLINGDSFTMNRCRIVEKVMSKRKIHYRVYCLDHGDYFTVSKEDLFQGIDKYFLKLPFQAIDVKLAGFKENLGLDTRQKLKNHLYSLSRDESNQNISLRAFSDQIGLHLFIKTDEMQERGSRGKKKIVFSPISKFLIELDANLTHYIEDIDEADSLADIVISVD